MKKAVLLLFIGLIVLIYGCEAIPPKYLQLVSPVEDIATQNQPYTLKFFVINPTQNTFTGTVEYEFDSNCLNSYPTSENVEITPREYKRGINKNFNYVTENSRYGADRNNCLQTPLRIIVTLKDRGGDVRDTMSVLLTIS